MGRAELRNMHNRMKTKRRHKDIDEINEDMKPEKADKLLNQEVDQDMPGNAQFYCIHCGRHFVDNKAMEAHFRSKVHKRRLKALASEPYSQAEANRAAGMGSYVKPELRKVTTQDVKEDMDDHDEDEPTTKKKKT